MGKQFALMLAVAMGTPYATAKSNLDAAFPDPAQPLPKETIGRRCELIGAEVVTTEIAADGTMTEISRVPVSPLVPGVAV